LQLRPVATALPFGELGWHPREMLVPQLSASALLLLLLFASGCGDDSNASTSGGPGSGAPGSASNTVANLADAKKIYAALQAVTQRGARMSGACPDGSGSVAAKTALMAGSNSSTTNLEFTFSSCLSQGVTLDGTLNTSVSISIALDKEPPTPSVSERDVGSLTTSLGVCSVDMTAGGAITISNAAVSDPLASQSVTGTWCGFDAQLVVGG
jgi:hypothetical protein